MSGIIIIGAGGHGKVIANSVLLQGRRLIGFLDDNADLHGTSNNYGQIFGGLDRVPDFPDAQFVIGLGSNQDRSQVAQQLAYLPQTAWATIVHPSTIIAHTVEIGVGTVVFGGATISVDSKIGDQCIISGNCLIGHDCLLEDFTHIAPNATVCGHVHIQTGAMMSVSSTAVPSITVGEWSQVAAGAVAVKHVPAHTIVKGIPAK